MDHLYWYVAESDYGQMYVGIDKQNNKNHSSNNNLSVAMQMAMALHEKELLIQEIENWLNIGFKLRPATIRPSSIHMLYVQMKHSDRFYDNDRIVIGFHMQSLTNLPAPVSVQLKKTEITSSSLPIDIMLAEFDIPTEQYNKESILIVPDSYESVWKVKLSVSGNNEISCAGMLSKDGKSLRITKRNHQRQRVVKEESELEVKDSDNTISVKILVLEKIRLPFDKILCWQPDSEIILERSVKQYSTIILCDKEVKGKGHLVSIAGGYGVFIES
jgi:hypothetical protein